MYIIYYNKDDLAMLNKFSWLGLVPTHADWYPFSNSHTYLVGWKPSNLGSVMENGNEMFLGVLWQWEIFNWQDMYVICTSKYCFMVVGLQCKYLMILKQGYNKGL